MNKSGLAAAFAAAFFYSFDGAAFQLGQLHGNSRQGQPLAARIELYGLSAAEAARLELTLKPDIRSAHDDAARGVVDAIEAYVARDAAGQPYIALRSAAPLELSRLEFRLRARLGERASIAHLELDLPASTPMARRAPRPRPSHPSAPTSAAGTVVGPVRAGDSLWRILAAHGLTGGDVAATIARVVADNPHAFVDGDANRLRVDAMLTLPTALGTTAGESPQQVPTPAPMGSTSPADTAATRPAVATRRTVSGARDEELQARLDALSTKFAAIRARYANGTPSAMSPAATTAATLESSEADAETDVMAPIEEATIAAAEDIAEAATSPAEEVAAPAPTATAEPGTVQASATPSPPAASEPVEARRAAPQATTAPASAEDTRLPEIPVSRLLLLAVAGTISLVALVSGIGTVLRRLRARRRIGTERAADEEKVAAIARKATRRLELEEDVRRRLGGQRGATGVEAGASDSRFGTIDTQLAHGNYREAEALLGDIIAAAPDNYRAGLRLLELYYLERRGEDFAALAGALQREHRDDIDDEAWQRVMRMGKVLTPNHPPFSGPVALARTA